jgi:hypothetical protein
MELMLALITARPRVTKDPPSRFDFLFAIGRGGRHRFPLRPGPGLACGFRQVFLFSRHYFTLRE